jgi:hypothetical protein
MFSSAFRYGNVGEIPNDQTALWTRRQREGSATLSSHKPSQDEMDEE